MYTSTCTELFTLNHKFVGYELSFCEKSVTFSTTEKAVSQLDLQLVQWQYIVTYLNLWWSLAFRKYFGG